MEIINIRQGRKVPGLQPQHLTSVSACKKISGAQVEGDSLQSTSLRFFPGDITGGEFTFDVAEKKGSAGSTSLVLQTIFLPLCRAQTNSKLEVLGGTHVPWSPPFHYLKDIFIPMVKKIGCNVDLEIRNWGWYPKGGGEVAGTIMPTTKFLPLELTDRGKLLNLSGISAVSNLPVSIAERQKDHALRILKEKGFSAEISLYQAPSIGQGTFFFLKAEFENSVAGFSSLGEIGKRAERVAEEACEEFLRFMQTEGAVDPHLADQLIPYLALAEGNSAFTVSKITNHLLTNIWMVKQFLKRDILVEGEEGEEGKVTIRD